MAVLNCTTCCKEYNVKAYELARSKYCSVVCKNKGLSGRPAWNKTVWPILNCIWCGKEYSVKPSRMSKSKYCSTSCQGSGTVGVAVKTKEWKEKIGKAHKGKTVSEFSRELIRVKAIGRKQSDLQIANRVIKNTGQKRSDEVKRKMSESALKVDLSKKARGCKSARWKGGITPINAQIRHSTEYAKWRKMVFERDNYTCISCGQWGRELNADHIKPFSLFPEFRFDVDNGRTLCKKCHIDTPTYAGKLKALTKTDFLKNAI